MEDRELEFKDPLAANSWLLEMNSITMRDDGKCSLEGYWVALVHKLFMLCDYVND